MSTLITAGVLLVVAVWALTAYGRLLRLRREVTRHWRDVHGLRRRQQDLTASDAAATADAEASHGAAGRLEHAERLYNLVATRYNLAITSPPANLVAGLAGFKRAELIESRPPDS